MSVTLSPRAFLAWARTPTGTKMVRYLMTSVISVAISQVVLLVTFGILNLWSAVVCNIVASVIATPPSYYLNRKWAWGKRGRSHLLKEVIPFWALAFLGLGFSIWAVDAMETFAHGVTNSHALTSILVMIAQLAAFGVVWVFKFVIFNHLMFVDHEAKKRARLEAKAQKKVAVSVVGQPPTPSGNGKREGSQAPDVEVPSPADLSG